MLWGFNIVSRGPNFINYERNTIKMMALWLIFSDHFVVFLTSEQINFKDKNFVMFKKAKKHLGENLLF